MMRNICDSRGNLVPGHALHEKGLQRQIGVGTLVNSQQRRALAVPRINRWSTGRFVPPPVYIGFPLFVLAKRRSEHLFKVLWRARGAVGFQGHRNVGTLFCPASPRPAVRPATCRPVPPVVFPGFGFDRLKRTTVICWRGTPHLHCRPRLPQRPRLLPRLRLPCRHCT